MTRAVDVRSLATPPKVWRAARRIERLLAHGLLDPPRGVLEIARASDPEELREAYALVHNVFVREGFIAPMPRGMRLRVYELLPEMCTFVARLNGAIVGVMSVVPDSPDLGLPSDAAFQDELDLLRRARGRLVEITNLAVRDELRSTSVFLELARFITAHVIDQGYTDAFVAVSPKHALFFEGVLRFEPWGKRRVYDARSSDVVQGNRCDIQRFSAELRAVDAQLGARAFLHAWFFDDNPAFERAESSTRSGGVFPPRARALRALLDDPTEWLDRLSPQQRRTLDERWRAAG
jgi:hypothetical protein